VIYIGIDPGVSGGIGVIRSIKANHKNNPATYNYVEAFKMPATEMDLVELFRSLGDGKPYGSTYGIFAYLEKAQAFPGAQKITRCPRCLHSIKIRQSQGVSSTFKFGVQYGSLKGILTALRIPFELIRPVDWQRALGCLTKGDKNISKAKAQQLFPDIKWIHATADSILIAEFCRRMRNQGVSFSHTSNRSKVGDIHGFSD